MAALVAFKHVSITPLHRDRIGARDPIPAARVESPLPGALRRLRPCTGKPGGTDVGSDRSGRTPGRQGVVRLHQRRSAPRHRCLGRGVLGRLRSARPRSGAAEPRTARQARGAAAADRRLVPGESRRADRPGGIQERPARNRLPRPGGRRRQRPHRQCRPGDLDRCRPAAGGSGHQRPLRPECGERPLGEPVRRALRHRHDPGGRRLRAYRRLQPGPRRARVIAWARDFLDRVATPLASGQPCGRDAIRGGGRRTRA